MNFAVGGSVIEGIPHNYLTKQMGIMQTSKKSWTLQFVALSIINDRGNLQFDQINQLSQFRTPKQLLRLSLSVWFLEWLAMATWSDQGYFPSNSAENVDRSNYQASPIWYQPEEDKPDENQMLL